MHAFEDVRKIIRTFKTNFRRPGNDPIVTLLSKTATEEWRRTGGRMMVAVNEKRNEHPHQRGWARGKLCQLV